MIHGLHYSSHLIYRIWYLICHSFYLIFYIWNMAYVEWPSVLCTSTMCVVHLGVERPQLHFLWVCNHSRVALLPFFGNFGLGWRVGEEVKGTWLDGGCGQEKDSIGISFFFFLQVTYFKHFILIGLCSSSSFLARVSDMFKQDRICVVIITQSTLFFLKSHSFSLTISLP